MGISRSELITYARLNESSGNRGGVIVKETYTQNGTVTQEGRTLGVGARFDGNSANFLKWNSSGSAIDRTKPLWVFGGLKPAAVASQSPITSYNGLTNGTFIVNMTNTGELAFLVLSSGGSIVGIGSPASYVTDTEYFFQGWLEEDTGSPGNYLVRMQINDNAPLTGATVTLPYGVGSDDITIGRRTVSGDPRSYNGLVYEYGIFNRTPAPDERAELFERVTAKEHIFARRVVTVMDGPWSTAGTWDEGVPGANDDVVIGHNVTVTAPATIGNHEPEDDEPAIRITSAGSLTVEDVLLTVKGDIAAPGTNATKIDLQAGAIIEFDCLTRDYSLTLPAQYPGTTPQLRARGAQGNRAEIRTKSGATGRGYIVGDAFQYSGLIDAEFTNFTRLGSASINAIESAVQGESDSEYSIFRLIDCIFDACGRTRWYYNVGTHARVTLQRSLWKNTVATVAFEWFSYNAKATSGIRLITDCDFDKHVELKAPRDLTLTNNSFRQGYTTTSTDAAGWALSAGNLVVLDPSYQGITPAGSIDNEYWLHSDAAKENPHFLQAGTYPGIPTQEIENCIFEFAGTDGNGDCILLAAPGSAVTVAVRNCITLPNEGGLCSGTLISALGGANITALADNNTVYCGGQPGIAVGETYTGHAGMFSSIRGNIFWDSVTGRSYKVADSGTNDNVEDLIASGNLNFNSGLRMLTGSNSKGYHQLEFSSGAPGASDLEGADPNFVDSTRDIKKWDTTLSGPGTINNALNEIRKRNEDSGYNSSYSIGALLAYIRGGFTPTNAAFSGASHTAGDLGAVPVVGGAAPQRPSAPMLMMIGG